MSNMIPHKNLVLAVVATVNSIMNDGKLADLAIEKVLKSNPKWGSKDRKFIAESTYNIVRYFRRYQEFVQLESDSPDYIPALVWVYLLSVGYDMPDWVETAPFSNKIKNYSLSVFENKSRAVRESIPEWLDYLGETELGAQWTEVISSLNNEAEVFLRINSLRVSPEILVKELLNDGIESEICKEVPGCVRLKKRANVFRTESFKKGLFEVQDINSQRVVPFLDIQPGMRVIDACAGAGGKTLHIATQMNNKGRVIALDTDKWKLDELQRRAKRNGVSTIETRLIDSSKIVKRLEEGCDRLLLDVPCSGLGVLRRNPDAKWKLTPEKIKSLEETQKKILESYSKMVKVGGKLVYATCSILPSENEKRIEEFLSQNGDKFELEEELKLLPSTTTGDGFYMARIIRKA